MLTAVLCVLLGTVVSYVFFSLRALPKAPDAPDSPAPTGTDDILLNALIVREEQVLVSPLPYTRLIVAEGQRVGVSDTLGCAFSSEEDVRSSGEISRLLSALRDAASPPSARAARLTLSACLARQDMGLLSLAGRGVRYAMLPGGAEDARRDEALLSAQAEQLRSLVTVGAELLTSPAAGLFSAQCDGYESLSPAALSDLTPGALEHLLSSGSEPSASYGRLITGSEWRMVSLVPAGDAAHLMEGATVSLELSALSRCVNARVLSVSEEESGVCAAVFSSREALSDVLSLRHAQVRLRLPETEITP